MVSIKGKLCFLLQLILFLLQENNGMVPLITIFEINETLPFVGHFTLQSGNYSLIKCSSLCLSNYECFAVEYEEAENSCKVVLYNTISNEIGNKKGTLYMRQRVCRYDGYQYLWEIDLCIRFVVEGKTWTDAKLTCEDEKGQLATPENLEKESMILDMLSKEHEKKAIERAFWIGGSDIAEEGHFKWLNGQPFTYLNWSPGQPNDYSNAMPRTGADCVAYQAISFVWLDQNCNEVRSSVCENRVFI